MELSRRSKSRLRRLSENIRKEVSGSKSNPVIGQGDATVGKTLNLCLAIFLPIVSPPDDAMFLILQLNCRAEE